MRTYKFEDIVYDSKWRIGENVSTRRIKVRRQPEVVRQAAEEALVGVLQRIRVLTDPMLFVPGEASPKKIILEIEKLSETIYALDNLTEFHETIEEDSDVMHVWNEETKEFDRVIR